jgi:hypothetical protein
MEENEQLLDGGTSQCVGAAGKSAEPTGPCAGSQRPRHLRAQILKDAAL